MNNHEVLVVGVLIGIIVVSLANTLGRRSIEAQNEMWKLHFGERSVQISIWMFRLVGVLIIISSVVKALSHQ